MLFSLPKGTAHGGVIRKGKRKSARPIATKKPMHVVLRSTKAVGRFSFLLPKHVRLIEALIKAAQKRFHVKVYEKANSGNHLHLCVRAQTRGGFKNFLRYLTCQIAQAITGAKKGKPFGKFWDELAFSRIVQWGQDFVGVLAYVRQNTLEASGQAPRRLKFGLHGAARARPADL